MRYKILSLAAVAAMATAAFMFTSPSHVDAADGHASQDPTSVGSSPTVKGDSTKPSSCKYKVTGKTNELGLFYFDIKNASNIDAKDFHLKMIKPAKGDWKVEWQMHNGDFSGGNESRPTMPNPDKKEGDALPNEVPNPGQIGVDVAGAAVFKHDESHGMGVKVSKTDGDGNEKLYKNQEITLCVWLTRDAASDVVVSAFSPNRVGGTALLATTMPIPGLDHDIVSVEAGSTSVTVNTLAIAEVDDYRFASGSLMIEPDGANSRFRLPDELLGEEGLKVEVYDESGNIVCNRAEIGLWNPRIDQLGNFVVDVWRNPASASAYVIAIRNLRLDGIEYGQPEMVYTASMKGAALQGLDIVECFELVTIVPSED